MRLIGTKNFSLSMNSLRGMKLVMIICRSVRPFRPALIDGLTVDGESLLDLSWDGAAWESN